MRKAAWITDQEWDEYLADLDAIIAEHGEAERAYQHEQISLHSRDRGNV